MSCSSGFNHDFSLAVNLSQTELCSTVVAKVLSVIAVHQNFCWSWTSDFQISSALPESNHSNLTAIENVGFRKSWSSGRPVFECHKFESKLKSKNARKGEILKDFESNFSGWMNEWKISELSLERILRKLWMQSTTAAATAAMTTMMTTTATITTNDNSNNIDSDSVF